jgi:hypothetical protein
LIAVTHLIIILSLRNFIPKRNSYMAKATAVYSDIANEATLFTDWQIYEGK